MSATDATPDGQRLRAGLRKAVLGRICNVSNLPDWMQTSALGRNMGPLAEIVVDALLPVIAADRERYAQQRAAEALREAAAIVVNQRDGYLVSPGLDRAWQAGWHAATDHHAARLRNRANAEATP